MSTNLPGRSAALLFALALALAACGSNAASDTETAEATETTEAPVATEAPTVEEAEEPATGSNDEINGGKPEVEIPAGDAPTELGIDDLIEGDGAEVAAGDLLVMHYVGVLHANGEQFDASWDRGSTFNFTLGQGRVIQGWDEGIVGMKVGGRRLLNIPSAQAYGSNSQGGIPADSALVFVVDLVDAISPPAEIENADAPVTELEVTVIEEGDGDVITAESFVDIHYQLMAQSTGTLIESSWVGGQSLPFPMATPPIPGWGEALLGKRAGDSLRIVIPPALGIGQEGGPIGLEETLVTEIRVMSVTN